MVPRGVWTGVCVASRGVLGAGRGGLRVRRDPPLEAAPREFRLPRLSGSGAGAVRCTSVEDRFAEDEAGALRIIPDPPKELRLVPLVRGTTLGSELLLCTAFRCGSELLLCIAFDASFGSAFTAAFRTGDDPLSLLSGAFLTRALSLCGAFLTRALSPCGALLTRALSPCGALLTRALSPLLSSPGVAGVCLRPGTHLTRELIYPTPLPLLPRGDGGAIKYRN
eukprot:Hpha_TRINITY_DN13712_c0_g1::TRINITY_DN13712_c0_g1_i1::g.142190::m.142190